VRLLHRLQVDGGSRDLEEVAVELDDVVGPGASHDFEKLVRAGSAIAHRDTHRIVLVLRPPLPEPKHKPATGEHVYRRGAPRKGERGDSAHHQHVRAQSNARAMRGREREHIQRVHHPAEVVRIGAVRRSDIPGLGLDRDEQTIPGPEAVVPKLLRTARNGHDPLWLASGTRQRQSEPSFTAHLPLVETSAVRCDPGRRTTKGEPSCLAGRGPQS